MGRLAVFGEMCAGGWHDMSATDVFSLDLAYGIGEDPQNDFELTVADMYVPGAGTVFYVDGTPYGGMVDAVGFDTGSHDLIWSGRTWQGVLARRVLRPPAGADYLTVSGTAEDVISAVIANSGISSATQPIRVGACTEATFTNYRFNRYVTAWEGLVAALGSVGLRPTFSVERSGGLSWLAVGATALKSVGGAADSDLVSFSGTRQLRATNHLVALGQGDLAQRTVRDLWAKRTSGGWAVQQTATVTLPLEEVAEAYDYPSAESAEVLVADGTERLLGYQTDGAFSVVLDGSVGVDVGDTVIAHEARLGISIEAVIEKVVARTAGDGLAVSYETGVAGYSRAHVTING